MDMGPNGSNIFTRMQNLYVEEHKLSVPLLLQWPLMASPMPTILATAVYVIFSWWLGPLLMKKREPFILREPMFIYNMLMFLLNVYILHEFITGAIQAGYTVPCMPLPRSLEPAHVKIASAVWWYFFSKLIEFMDTVFFVLRKKDRQISFLHVYHHASMAVLWWACAKWVPGGQSVYGATVNVTVHVIMYFYYAVSSLGEQYQKYLWWKKYLTQLQLVQFVYVMVLCSYSYYTECPFVTDVLVINFFQMVTFLILFLNFYIRSYLKTKSAKSKTS